MMVDTWFLLWKISYNGDKFGNKIKIKYKKELDLIDYIENKNGKLSLYILMILS